MRTRLVLVFVLGALAATLVAAPARADSGITAVSGHQLIKQYTTAGGNTYRMDAHLALGFNDASGGGHGWHARVHYHCTRNGAVWDGCRIQTRISIQRLISGGIWQVQGSSSTDYQSYPQPFEDWFSNSNTLTSTSIIYGQGQATIRAIIHEPDAVRFRLADGTTALFDAISGATSPSSTT